ncbi:TPA: hypothetical protein ACHK19_004006 [Escherichia coli]
MNTLTKEWLQNTITSIESARDEISFGLDEDQNNMLTALKIALASLGAEPVAYIFKHPAWKLFWALTDESNKDQSDVIPVYAAPPAPVVPEGLVKAVRFYEQVRRENPPVETGAWKDAIDWVLKEACCAAILGKADNPPASGNQVSELTMWVKRLASQLEKAKPDCKLPEKAMDYLKRNELINAEDVLR